MTWGFAVPHPLDVNIRQVPGDTHYLNVNGRVHEFYAGPCPDGCGLVAWTNDMLPFNAPTLDDARNRIRTAYVHR